MSDSQTERVPTPRALRVPTPRRTNERTNRRRGWIDSRATSWRTCQPSFAGRTWRNPPSSLCKRNSRPSSGWGCRRRKTLSGNRCAHEFPNPNPRLCAFLGGVASKFFRMNATRDTTDGYAFATMYRSIHWRHFVVVVVLGRRRRRPWSQRSFERKINFYRSNHAPRSRTLNARANCAEFGFSRQPNQPRWDDGCDERV